MPAKAKAKPRVGVRQNRPPRWSGRPIYFRHPPEPGGPRPPPADGMKTPRPAGPARSHCQIDDSRPLCAVAGAHRLEVIPLPRGVRSRPARSPLHLGHLAAQAADRRELVRMGRLVQGPLPGLDQNPVRVQPSGVAAEPHRAPEGTHHQLGSWRLRRRRRGPEQI